MSRNDKLALMRKIKPSATHESRKTIEARVFRLSKSRNLLYDDLMFEVLGAYEILDEENFNLFLSQLDLGYGIRDTILFEKPAADEFRIQESYFEEEKVIEGARKCKKCGSRRLKIKIRQVRRGDEGPTEFATCADCGAG